MRDILALALMGSIVMKKLRHKRVKIEANIAIGTKVKAHEFVWNFCHAQNERRKETLAV